MAAMAPLSHRVRCAPVALLTLTATLAAAPASIDRPEPGAQDAAVGPRIVTADPPRRGRGLAVLAFAGEPHPVLVARALRLAGSQDLPGEDFNAFLAERSATVGIVPRGFGLELVIESDGRRLAEVIAATGRLLIAPAWSEDVAHDAVYNAAFGGDDPLAAFDRAATLLLDAEARAAHVARLASQPAAGDAGPEDDRPGGDGEGDGAGGGFPFELPPLPVPPVAELEERARALLLGPRAALVAVDDGGPARAAMAALLRGLPPGDLPTPTAPEPAPVPERTYLTAIDELPGAIVGWIAPLAPDPSGAAAVGWAAFEAGPLADALADHLLPGTVATVRLTPVGDGPASVRVRALVRADAAARAAADLREAVALIGDWTPDAPAVERALERLYRDGEAPLAPGQPRWSVRIARALFDVEDAIPTRAALAAVLESDPAAAARAAAAAVDVAAGRLSIAAQPAVVAELAAALAPAWRLDRTAWEQSAPEARAAAETVLAAVGGADRWAALESIRFRSETRAGGSASRAQPREAVQWRDLVRPRFVLEEVAGAALVTTVADGARVRQDIDGQKGREFGPAIAERLQALHRASLLVLLHDLAGRRTVGVELDEADGERRLRLVELDGERAALIVGDDGRPAGVEAMGGRTDFFEWTDVDGFQIPLHQRALQPPATHRWSEVDVAPPTPAVLD